MTKVPFDAAVLAAVAALSASSLASASSEKVLYSFPSESTVFGQVQEDRLGNLYGTTYLEDGSGTVYELSEHHGNWNRRIVHVFGSDSDGASPHAGLNSDHIDGIFYGTTTSGGYYGDGTVFSLVPSGRQWTEHVLHHFEHSDGADPMGLMTRDKATGVLYGTAFQGGTYNCGTVFRLDPTTTQLDVLYSFQGGNHDGCDPETQMSPGSNAGTLFGATAGGGPHNVGTVFQLTQNNGNWMESVLYTFHNRDDGAFPVDITEPARASPDCIYGVAQNGGHGGQGVAFRLSMASGKWIYRVIHVFTGGNDGAQPMGLHLDQQTGLLYGTTLAGGTFNEGVVFKLANLGGRRWRETVLHSFSGGSDGANPASRPIVDPRTDILYGTTLVGGTFSGGTVYAVTP